MEAILSLFLYSLMGIEFIRGLRGVSVLHYVLNSSQFVQTSAVAK